MKNLLILLLSFGILIAPSVKAEKVLYCQSELVTGFIKENGSWSTSNFKPQRFTIKFNDDYSELSGLDSDRPYLCDQAYSFAPNALACISGYNNGTSFLFNKAKKRFVWSRITLYGGYDRNLPNADTDALIAGTCETF